MNLDEKILQIYSGFYNRNNDSESNTLACAVNSLCAKAPATLSPQLTRDTYTGSTSSHQDKKLINDIQSVKNSFESITKIKNKINSIDNNLKKEALNLALAPFPFARRVEPIEENSKDNNSAKAAGLGIIALINASEDLRDLLALFGMSKSSAPKGYHTKFRFFAGTVAEKYLKKSEPGRFILNKVDTTVNDSDFIEKVYKLLKIKKKTRLFTKETKYPFINKTEIIEREYIKFSGPFWKRLTGLSLSRITKIGLIAMALLEIPNICKALKEKDRKQLIKSGMNIVIPISCGGLTSAFLALALAPFGLAGTIGSIAGLGLGIHLGNKLVDYSTKN